MKLKYSAIAVAVAGALGASMAAHAASDSGFYADLRVGFQSTDTGGESQITIENQVSRFGFRGSTDMGNGLTGYGRMEFGLRTEGGDPSPLTRRHAYVGLSGDWGDVRVGQSYFTFYNFIVGPLDNPMLGTGSSWLGYTGRTDQAIGYTGEWGIFSLGATGYFDDSSTDVNGSPNDLDGYEIAGAFQAGPVNLALGIKDQDEGMYDIFRGFDPAGATDVRFDPEPIIGLTASGWQTGIFTWGLGYNMQDGDTTVGAPDMASIIFDVLIGNGYVHLEQTDIDGSGVSIKPTAVTLGYAQPLGRNTNMYYEYETVDADTGDSNDDVERITAALRYKWN
jgi:predicted porin